MINETTMLMIDCISNMYKTNILSVQRIRKNRHSWNRINLFTWAGWEKNV